MRFSRSIHVATAFAAALVTLGCWAVADAGATPTSCGGFPSQAAAQERFDALGGRPSRNAVGLDADGDGVACEGLPSPYAGYATIGYNRAKGFYYGTATMPSRGSGEGFACLAGNSHFAEGPRLLKVYRVGPGPDLAISRALGAEARPASGRLLWKLDVPLGAPGRYYAVFEAEVRLSPYRPSECPRFSSSPTQLPRPRR